MKIASVKEMQNMDKTAIETYGISDVLLMENAGVAVFSVILQEFGIKDRSFVIVCGSGNNGGDGLVVARKIHSMGGNVRVFILGNTDHFKGAAKKNFGIISRLPIPVKTISSAGSLNKEIARCDAVVDGIFGTGLARSVEGIYQKIIESINASGKVIFSIDIPSGINGDSGQVMGAAIRADYTVTFGLPKTGTLLYPGYSHCGKLFVTHISFPRELCTSDTLKVELNSPAPLPVRKPHGHKGHFGDVLFIAGATNYFGAPAFSALSFLKAGGGYSRLAAPKSIVPFIASQGSEIVFAPQEETSTGSLALQNLDVLINLTKIVDMVVIGPGLSLNEETQNLVRELVVRIRKPILIDGDGLTAVSRDMQLVSKRKSPTILTPHLGEMANMAGTTIPEVDMHKIDKLQKYAKEWKSIIVLKGAHSLIGTPDEKIFINLSGNSGMATAGSGDVLTGAIAAMLGLGLPVEEAVRTGTFLHGFSGDLAAEEKGEDGMTAQDILDFLPIAVQTYRNAYFDIMADRYQKIFPV
ncbi:NAD(P)H-hydrate dehydratase [bacterium]